MSTVAEQLVEVLIQAGVARVYGVVGDSLNPFVDAIRRAEGIEWIHTRNEEAGALRLPPRHTSPASSRSVRAAVGRGTRT